MRKVYDAVLTGDRIEWTGAKPDINGEPVPVRVEVVEPEPTMSDEERREKLFHALERLAAVATNFPEDAVAWQREQREDRVFPGREE